MSRTLVHCLFLLVLLAGAGSTRAESTTPKRKAITYLGMRITEGLVVPLPYAVAIEQALREQVEMKRFDYISLAVEGGMTMQQFLEQYRDLLARKASEDDPTGEPVWAKDLERIIGSAFFYELQVNTFMVDVYTDEYERQEAQLSLTASVQIYRLDLSDPLKPGYRLEASLMKVVPDSELVKLQAGQDLAVQTIPVLARLASQIGTHLALQIRRLPTFQLKATVLKVESDGVTLPMGKSLGVTLDDTFELVTEEASGERRYAGYVKVRKVEKETCYAENIVVADGWTFSGAEMALEDAMVGVGIGLEALVEVATGDLLGKGGAGVYPGFGITAAVDVGNAVDWPETHLLVHFDTIFLGDAPGTDLFVTLAHMNIGMMKKWFIHRLALSVGLEAGAAYYFYSESGLSEEGPHLGFGGDLLLGAEVFLSPYASLYARVKGRLYTNPIDWVENTKTELALATQAGIMFTF